MEKITFLWSAAGGFFFGSLVGMAVGIGFFIGGILGAAGTFLIASRFVKGAGRSIEKLSSGESTPHTPDYSRPESLANRGQFEKAIEAYEEHIWASPEVPEPYVRIARIYRDKLDRADEAERWFRRARKEAHVPTGLDLLITQELIELYLHTLKAPRKAIPELAHICSAHRDTPAAEAAEQELTDLRAMLACEADGGGSVTDQYLRKHSPHRRPEENQEHP
jgi:tetratricopeptide (TPR) repeat protein